MKTEAERQLAELVSMPTIADNVGAKEQALDYIETYFVKRGLCTKRFMLGGHGSLMATVRPEAKTPKVLLNAHIDVMAGDESLFTLRRQGDKLLGRGVYDMKFAIAAYMQLVDELHDELLSYDFGIMITSDEELAGRDGINGVDQLARLGYLPEICFMPDGGTDWDIETLAKGGWRFDLIATGKTAHGSRPWEGESASFKLIRALHDLKQHFNEQGPLTDTLNIGTIHGGVTYNQVPDNMVAGVDIRLSDNKSLARNQKLLKTICKQYGLKMETRVLKEPLKTNPQNPLIVAFADSIQAVTSRRAESCISYASSDAIFYAAFGVPCILTRPQGGGHHGPDEWLGGRSFAQLVPVLKDYLDRVAKIAPTPVDR